VDAGGAKDEGAILRTAKACGPDLATLGSSRRKQFRRRRWQKTGHRGEHVIGVKTIAQGKPDQFGEPVVTMLVCFITFAREAAGALGTGFPCALCFFEGDV
jgi:hypothetical protein